MRAGTLALACGALLAVPSARAEVSSSDLIERAADWDGKRVVYRGEAVGEAMKRGDFAWLNLHDGSNAIGVWCPFRFAERVRIPGDYFHSGDMVRVTGVFHRACPEHGGDLDIHAVSLDLASAGRDRAHPVSRRKALAAGGLCLLAGAFALWERRRRTRDRKIV